MDLDSAPKPLRLLGAVGLTAIGIIGVLTPQNRLIGFLLMVAGGLALTRELAPKLWKRITNA
jgi:hypothetical protein